MCKDYSMTDCVKSGDPQPCVDCKEIRDTGRSQRDIVRALSQALMGKSVLFVSMTPESGRAHWQVAWDWLKANGFIGHSTVCMLPHENRIRMGVGSVLFSMGQSMSGPRLHCIQHIVEDHSVTECNAAKAEQDRTEAEKVADLAEVVRLLDKHGITHVTSPRQQYGATYYCHLKG